MVVIRVAMEATNKAGQISLHSCMMIKAATDCDYRYSSDTKERGKVQEHYALISANLSIDKTQGAHSFTE
jgi:hypothetical protein